jgi:hypothetical protein
MWILYRRRAVPGRTYPLLQEAHLHECFDFGSNLVWYTRAVTTRFHCGSISSSEDKKTMSRRQYAGFNYALLVGLE